MYSDVWIDIGHLAQFNFYRNSIIELSNHYRVIVSVLKRGSLFQIVKNELSGTDVIVKQVGSHSKSKLGIYLKSNILRFFQLLLFCVKFKPKINLSNGYLSALVALLYRIPRYQFGDDPEHYDRRLKSAFSTKSLYCIPYPGVLQINRINAPKEWAYLSPKYFTPDESVLLRYGLEREKYIFIREVSTRTTNYGQQASYSILKQNIKPPTGFKMVISLESMEMKHAYPSNWILLPSKEPGVHSLIYFSALLVSSGDSMAREGAALGVRSIYCGSRMMRANIAYERIGLLVHLRPEKIQHELDELAMTVWDINRKEIIRNAMDSMWIDVNEHIIDLVTSELGE